MKINPPQENFARDSHCGFCGTRFTEQKLWPRKCFRCNNESYKNPVPIVVGIIPVLADDGYDLGFLIEQRNIEPSKGGWAFPSGYVNFGETWEQAIVRELKEEVNLTTEEKDWSLFKVVMPSSGNMLMFCTHPGVRQSSILFTPNEEVSAIQITPGPEHTELCFPTHVEMWAKYMNGFKG